MTELEAYKHAAMKRAALKALEAGEGYSAKIPGFPGLLVFGKTKSEALSELQSALSGWIELSLKRGYGLPSLHAETQELALTH